MLFKSTMVPWLCGDHGRDFWSPGHKSLRPMCAGQPFHPLGFLISLTSHFSSQKTLCLPGLGVPWSSWLHQSQRPRAVIGQSLSHAHASKSHQMKTSLTLVITITIVISYDDRQRCPGNSHRPGRGTRRVTLTAAQRLRGNWERCFKIKLKFWLSKQS